MEQQYHGEKVGEFNFVNQGETDYTLGLKRVRILDCKTVLGQNLYTLIDEDGNQYEKRGHEIIVHNHAWYLE